MLLPLQGAGVCGRYVTQGAASPLSLRGSALGWRITALSARIISKMFGVLFVLEELIKLRKCRARTLDLL